MIKSVYVDGLRSLKGVKIDLQPGLNALVGPNGSGKSNIVTAFDLISRLGGLNYMGPYDRVGSTNVHGLFDADGKNKKIDLTIEGEIGQTDLQSCWKDCNSLYYRYGCTIEYDLHYGNGLFFSKQFLELNATLDAPPEIKKFAAKFDNNKLTFEECDDFYMKQIAGEVFNGRSKESWVKADYLNIIFLNRHQVLKSKPMIHDLCSYFEPLKFAVRHFESGRVFNINPDIVRYNIFKKDAPLISHDGSGLLSALLRICENNKGINDTTYKENGNGINYRNTYNIILSFLEYISPQIVGLDVALSASGQKIDGNILFEETNGKTNKTSFELISDGSLKWLSLITALLINITNKSLFVLEEPENYLHPTMQQLIVDFMKETLEDDHEIRLFSTHSETILNKLTPEEVILTFYRDGQTVIQKIEDPKELNKAIEETGFGIGSQFVVGLFDYENIN